MRVRNGVGVKAVTVLMVAMLAALAAVAGAGCGSGEPSAEPVGEPPSADSPASPPAAEKVFTVEELAGFDGRDGRSAYVAVDGVVYDVTGSPDWPGGDHTQCSLDASAGKDLSGVLEQAPPSMRGYIEARPVVGTLK